MKLKRYTLSLGRGLIPTFRHFRDYHLNSNECFPLFLMMSHFHSVKAKIVNDLKNFKFEIQLFSASRWPSSTLTTQKSVCRVGVIKRGQKGVNRNIPKKVEQYNFNQYILTSQKRFNGFQVQVVVTPRLI